MTTLNQMLPKLRQTWQSLSPAYRNGLTILSAALVLILIGVALRRIAGIPSDTSSTDSTPSPSNTTTATCSTTTETLGSTVAKLWRGSPKTPEQNPPPGRGTPPPPPPAP